jgi:hypothetical protein
LLTELLGHVTCQHLQATLEGGIGRDASGGHTSSGAGKVDDASAVAQQWQQRLRQEEWAFEMYIEEAIELLLRHCSDRPEQAVSSVVYQPAQMTATPSFLQRLFDFGAEGRKEEVLETSSLSATALPSFASMARTTACAASGAVL